MPGTIADIAVADGRFTTLAAAPEAAGLVETLKGEGPFTVSAPTNEAFARLPEGTVEALPADIPALTDLLLYHGSKLPMWSVWRVLRRFLDSRSGLRPGAVRCS